MDRRQLLTATAGILVAGCAGDAPEEGGEQTGSGDGTSPSTRGDGTEELTVDTTVTDVNLDIWEREGASTTAVTGLVENTGEARLSSATATGKFYNANDQILSTSSWHIRDLETNEVWEPWVEYVGESDVDWAELAVTNTTPHRRTVWPSGIEIAEEDIQIPADDFANPRATGTIMNNSGSTLPVLLVCVKLYDQNDTLLETSITTVQSFEAGESWSFDLQIPFANIAWKSRAEGYKIVLSA